MAPNNVETPVTEKSIVETPVSNPEIENKATVKGLYEALEKGEAERVAGIVASDLEWWFHGPQNCQHMMRVLTGESGPTQFRFEPRSITAIDDRVIAEGWEGTQVYWVHVWTLKDGLITQFREYFNTWLTVSKLRPMGLVFGLEIPTLWQSQPRDLVNRSLPGLVLAI